MVDELEAQIKGRLVYDDFRKAYGRPFYRWDCDKKALKEHKRDILNHISNLDKMGLTEDAMQYRLKVCKEMLKDMEDIDV